MTAKEQLDILIKAFQAADNPNGREHERLAHLLHNDYATVYLDNDAVPTISFKSVTPNGTFHTIWKAEE